MSSTSIPEVAAWIPPGGGQAIGSSPQQPQQQETADDLVNRAAKRHNWTTARVEMMARLLRSEPRQVEAEMEGYLGSVAGSPQLPSDTRVGGIESRESESSMSSRTVMRSRHPSDLLDSRVPSSSNSISRSRPSVEAAPWLPSASAGPFDGAVASHEKYLSRRPGASSSGAAGEAHAPPKWRSGGEGLMMHRTGSLGQQGRHGSNSSLVELAGAKSVGRLPLLTGTGLDSVWVTAAEEPHGEPAGAGGLVQGASRAGLRPGTSGLLPELGRRPTSIEASAQQLQGQQQAKAVTAPKSLQDLAELLRRQRLEQAAEPAAALSRSVSKKQVSFKSTQRSTTLTRPRNALVGHQYRDFAWEPPLLAPSSGSQTPALPARSSMPALFVHGAQELPNRPSMPNSFTEARINGSGRGALQPPPTPTPPPQPLPQQGGLWDLLENLRSRRLSVRTNASTLAEGIVAAEAAAAAAGMGSSMSSLGERVEEWQARSQEALLAAEPSKSSTPPGPPFTKSSTPLGPPRAVSPSAEDSGLRRRAIAERLFGGHAHNHPAALGEPPAGQLPLPPRGREERLRSTYSGTESVEPIEPRLAHAVSTDSRRSISIAPTPPADSRLIPSPRNDRVPLADATGMPRALNRNRPDG